MKSKLTAFAAILCIASLIASGANAKGKPNKPDDSGNTETELIVFTENLSGSQEVEGCCPNAGPYPSYTMTMSFPVADFVAGTSIDGQLFINNHGSGRDRGYIVQFWDDRHESDPDNHVAIEIKGGEVFTNKKTKAVTVLFDNVECVDLHSKEWIANVSFVLERTPN